MQLSTLAYGASLGIIAATSWLFVHAHHQRAEREDDGSSNTGGDRHNTPAPPPLPNRPHAAVQPQQQQIGNASASSSASSSSASPTSASSPSPSPPASSPATQQQQRDCVIKELLSTEQAYIDSLTVLLSCYYLPIAEIVSKAECIAIFSNIKSILKFHQDILAPELNKYNRHSSSESESESESESDNGNHGNIAAVIEKYGDGLKLYNEFVAHYSESLHTIARLGKDMKKFRQLLKQQRQHPTSRGLDMMSYLIMPVQRVPRYLLLLKELQRLTPAAHPHRETIDAAVSKIAKVATHINTTQRENENASKILEWQLQIIDMPKDITLFQPRRKLLQHTNATIVSEKGARTEATNTDADKKKNKPTAAAAAAADTLTDPCHVMLFTDLLLWTSADNVYRGSIAVTGATATIEGNELELTKRKGVLKPADASVRLRIDNEEEREKWIASLRGNGIAVSEPNVFSRLRNTVDAVASSRLWSTLSERMRPAVVRK